MGYSLLSMGQHQKGAAMKGLRDAANREERREAANKKLKAAERQQKVGTVVSGATTGAMVGMQAGSVGGPAGAAIGAVAGLALGELF